MTPRTPVPWPKRPKEDSKKKKIKEHAPVTSPAEPKRKYGGKTPRFLKIRTMVIHIKGTKESSEEKRRKITSVGLLAHVQSAGSGFESARGGE
jgi:hypothetical protein